MGHDFCHSRTTVGQLTKLFLGVCCLLKTCLVYLSFSGKDRFGFGFGGTGKKSNQSQFNDYGEVSWKLFLKALQQ